MSCSKRFSTTNRLIMASSKRFSTTGRLVMSCPKQFNTIDRLVMSCCKQFSTTDRLGLDFHKVLSSAKLQIFSINITRSLIKILNIRRTEIKPWGIPIKISICSLIADPIFTLCFRFKKELWNNFKLMLSKPYASHFAVINSWCSQ